MMGEWRSWGQQSKGALDAIKVAVAVVCHAMGERRSQGGRRGGTGLPSLLTCSCAALAHTYKEANVLFVLSHIVRSCLWRELLHSCRRNTGEQGRQAN